MNNYLVNERDRGFKMLSFNYKENLFWIKQVFNLFAKLNVSCLCTMQE